jgi:OTU-like cysteine protease
MVALTSRRNRFCNPSHARIILILGAVAGFSALLGSCSCVADKTAASTARTSTAKTTTPKSTESIPRSISRSNTALSDPGVPPWKLSASIDDEGFLKEQYLRVPGEWEDEYRLRGRYIKLDQSPPARIRQVPGDGNCLFHSISTCYAHAVNGTHIDLVGRSSSSNRSYNQNNKNNINDDDDNDNNNDTRWLYQHSTKLRQIAVDYLAERRKLLYLQGREYLRARDLVDAAASQYGISGEEYCELMRKDSYWGGGPEIVALCNALQRPIYVYELHVPEGRQHTNRRNRRNRKRPQPNKSIHDGGSSSSSSSSSTKSQRSQPLPSSSFVLRRMACFGSPKFDRHEPLHILSADSRFPDVDPGEQLPAGNHFLAIFPEPIRHLKRSSNSGTAGYDDEEEDDDDEVSGGCLRGGYDDGSSTRRERIVWYLVDLWNGLWS